MSKYTLTYEKDKSQEIYIEEIKEIGKDGSLYFNKEYEDSLNLIKAIVEAQINNKDNNANYSCNNRILFTGQRGSGKTSVMRSLAKYLSNEKTIVQNTNKTVVTFSCLPMVDPSHFDNNNNILLTVITNMFSEAKKKMNKDKDGGDTAKREDLLKQFEKVFKSLDSIKSELSSYTLESLNRKSDAEDLKDKMKDLVQKYLTFQGCGGDQSMLVLLIDDIDMSVSYAPEMLEQLRKYLELDNLIILMSANLGQLSNEMREKYSSAFQYTLKDSNQALSIDVEDLATKYLLKLFPTSRRINVERHVDQLLKTDLFVKGWNEKREKNDNTASEDNGNFQKVILSLIWSKTRLLFIPKDSENTLHPIIPTNLRDLAQFLDMLMGLKPVKPSEKNLFNDGEAYTNCNDNIQVFKRYFLNTWIPNHLSVEEELVFKNIPSDITEINKHLINSINVIGTKHKTRLMSREVSLDMIVRNAEDVNIDRDIYTMVSPNDPKFVKANKISDIFNQPSNYSYGDLLLMIDKYETYFESEEDRKFTDAIKIYYSILLFETMFFRSNEVEYDLNTFKAQIDAGKDMLIPIQKLIGGTVYYPNYFEIIKSKYFKQKGPSFDAKRAFYHKIKLNGSNIDEKRKSVGVKYPLFSVLYYGDIRPDRYETKHIYDTTFDEDADVEGTYYVTFDILAILNNMLNPCHTIWRMGEGFNSGIDFTQWKKDNGLIIMNGDRTEFKSLPNAILPFYSIDIMLSYLKHSYSTEEIGVKEEYLEYEKKMIKYTADIFATKELRFSQEIKDSSLFKELSTQKAISILIKAHGCYNQALTKCEDGSQVERISLTEMFKNHIIAYLLEEYNGGKRERNSLIKELHHYNTISELFSCLVESLWNNAIKEYGVRDRIQQKVRQKDKVGLYYNKLWKTTNDLLSNVSLIEDVDPRNIYRYICDESGKVFISPSFTLDLNDNA